MNTKCEDSNLRRFLFTFHWVVIFSCRFSMQSLIEIRLLVLGMRRAEVKLRVAGPDEHVLGESLSA